jgi:Ca2+-binding RTX toxin-like protein
MAQIVGTSSADTLTGTDGSDVFTGLAGRDVFTFNRTGVTQTDVITDFGSAYFTATIAGSQETPPTGSGASGTMTGVLNHARTEFNFTAQVSGLDFANLTLSTTDNVTAAHFHRAVAGVAGGIVYGFIGAPNNELQGETTLSATAAGGVVTGSWDAAEGNGTTLTAQAAGLLNNEIYINFHTTTNPGGEIRGQVMSLDGGLDQIDVLSMGVGDLQSLQQVMQEANGSTTIAANWNGQLVSMTLQGVPIASLTSADFIFADATAQTVNGPAGASDLFGAGGADIINGQSGADRIFAGAGADTVNGAGGTDTILGLGGADQLSGGGENDFINGNGGADVVNGDDGADMLRGGQGDDTLHGGPGADTLNGDLGNDILFGDSGADRFLFRPGAGTDWVSGFNFAEGDRVQLPTGTTYTVNNYFGQALITLSSGDSMGLVGIAPSSVTSDWVVFG